jgi:hypothetical protein
MSTEVKSTFMRHFLLLLLAWATACTTTHITPQEGTETGNPPVIDATLISLLVSEDALHVIGRPGAVSPGVEVEVVSVPSGASLRGQAAIDGSFDIVVNAPRADTFEVRAVQGTRSSSTVHVVRGAAVSQGSSQALSCVQREQLATAQIHAIGESADTSCARDEDCRLAPLGTQCSDACSGVPVSTAGAGEVQDARSAIESGLCKDFARDGCSFLVLPCVPPTSTNVGCRNQRCELIEPSPQASADCTSDFDVGSGDALTSVYWYYPQGGVCLPRTYGGLGGNANRYTSRAACEAACSRTGECPPNRVETEACVSPSPLAGCAETASACALVCSAQEQCVGDPIGNFCNRGFCESFSPE